MMKQGIDGFLAEIGYDKILSNLPEFTIYYRLESHCVNAIHIIDYRKGIYISADQYSEMKEKIRNLFVERNKLNVHILTVVIGEDIKKAETLGAGDEMCWLIDADSGRLLIGENQVQDFYGLKRSLENWLLAPDLEIRQEVAGHKNSGKLPLLTMGLVGINVLIFLICTFTGDLLYNIGALTASLVIDQRQVYRILSSIFLHWDINHLVSNMLILYFAGEMVEKEFGRIGYAMIYFAAGICGNFFSIFYEHYYSKAIISVGASGAIYGIIGCLLFLVIRHGGHYGQMTIRRMLFLLVYFLYSGFADPHTNNAAHLGGFVGGTIVAILLGFLHDMVIPRCVKRVKNKE